MVDVVIFSSREDLAAVTRLAEAVEADGYVVSWDADPPSQMTHGDATGGGIAAARAAIVVWSSASVRSERVRAEADAARNQKKLIQTTLGNVVPPLPFDQIQSAELGDWQGEPDHPGWRVVKASLAELCGRRDKTRPMSAAEQYRPAWPAAPSPTAPGKSSRGVLYAVLAVIGAVVMLGAGVLLGRGTLGPGSSGKDSPSGSESAAVLSPAAPASPAARASARSTAPAPASDAVNRRVTVVNLSNQTLRELYASPVTSDNWEEDLLGADVLPAGQSIDANVDNGTDECLYDFKAVMADDREHVRRKVNVCEISRWTIGDSGDSTS